MPQSWTKDRSMRRLATGVAALFAFCVVAHAAEPPHSAELDDMIVRQAKRHGVPEKLVRRIVMRESRYNPRARNRSFWGLMQISYPTAKSMGFKGSPNELLDPLVNLTYAVPYLANAFVIAGKEEDAAVRLYASGYYATAKNRNMLSSLRTADSEPLAPDDGFLAAAAKPVTKLITAVVAGPRSQVAATAAPEAVRAPGTAEAAGPEMTMRPGQVGNELPKKWTKDGGMTVASRGEQRIEAIAAYALGDAPAPSSVGGKSRKTTEFAAIYMPPANAQAYAPPAADPRDAMRQTESQAAITQATSGQEQSAAPPTATPDPDAADVKPRKHGHHAAAAKNTDGDADGAAPVKKASKPVHATAKKDIAKKDVAKKTVAAAEGAH